MSTFRIASVLALLAGTLVASGQNLVKDGDFELAVGGDPLGTPYTVGQPFDGGLWTIEAGGVVVDFYDRSSIQGTSVYIEPNSSIVQTLTTMPGQRYAFILASSSTGSPLAIDFGGQSFLPAQGLLAPTPSRSYFYSFDAVATGTSTRLTISPTGSGVEIDNVIVQATPEPSALAALGLGTFAALRHRKRALTTKSPRCRRLHRGREGGRNDPQP